MNKIEVVGDLSFVHITESEPFGLTKIEVEKTCTLKIRQVRHQNPIYIEIAKDQSLQLEWTSEEARNQFECILRKNSKLLVHQIARDSSDHIKIKLEEDAAECEYHYNILNHRENKLTMEIWHNAENTKSNVINHGVNDTDEKLVFDINGKIARQSSNCICTQENQIIERKEGDCSIYPNLWIENNEVEASHSAYIGSLKEEEIFYLMSRGLSRPQSEQLLLKGFLWKGKAVEETPFQEWMNPE